jgi:hypothetical protein
MSPTEATRKRWLEILADPIEGLNPEFVQQCTARNIPVPVASTGSTDREPFNFGTNSLNVWQLRGTPDFVAEGTGQATRYPCLFLYGVNALQNSGNSDRFLTNKFTGIVNLEILSYLAWPLDEPPDNNDFETPLDALEESFLAVTNRDTDLFQSPILYRGELTIQERIPVSILHEPDLFRCGLRLSFRALYLMQ